MNSKALSTDPNHSHGIAGRGPTLVGPPKDQSTYTCPMHHEVQQAGPGNCPKCGMRLEPKVAAVDDTEADGTESSVISNALRLRKVKL